MACCPGVSLSLYCSALAAVMVNNGCSLGNGSDRKPAASAVPAFFGKPPVQAGIDPSALPAISAPTGVSVVPSLAASSGDTAAMTLQASSERVSAPVCNRLFVVFIYRVFLKIPVRLEVHTEAECNEIAVDRRVVLATEEVGVSQASGVGVLVFGIQSKTDGLVAFVEHAVRAVAVHVMRPGHTGLEVDTGDGTVVVPDRLCAVTPGSAGDETVVFTVLADVLGAGTAQGTGVQDFASTTWQRARAIHRITTITSFGSALQPANMTHADLADQGQTRGAHDLIEEMGEGGLELGDFLTAIAMQIGARGSLQHRNIRVPQRSKAGKQDVGSIELHRRVRPVADLAAPGGAGRQGGGEAQAIQLDIFRILDEVLGVTRDGCRSQPSCGCLECGVGQYSVSYPGEYGRVGAGTT